MTQSTVKLLEPTEATTSLMQTTCAYCGVGCGIDVQVENSQPKTLKGTPEHPANFGRLCVKGTNLLETTDHNDRLLAPHIGDNQVSWDKANHYIAEKFNQLIAQHGKNSVAFYVSGQLLTEDYYVANKLMKGYIGSANIDTNSRLCMSSAVSAYKRAFGEDVVPCDYDDIENTDLLLITGANTAWTHPVLFQRIERAKQLNPNFKVVVIDPRKTATAENADIFLPIKPGTDAAFFNGLLSYISAQNYLDENYIEQHTQGFEQALTSAKIWDIHTTASYCELDIKALTEVYQLFCQSKRAVTFYSMGINQSSTGTDKCNAIINVHLATAKIARKGCGPFSITGQPNAMGGREVGGLANTLAAHMDLENPSHQQTVQQFWNSPAIANQQGAKAVDMFDKVLDGEIKAIWIMATNPLVSMPNRNKIEAALKKCPLVIVSDCVTDNDTLAFADVKLPATTWLEKNGTVTNSERRISRQRSIAIAPGLAKHDWQIISDIAKAMGFSGFDYQHPADIFNEHAALTGVNNNGSRQLDLSFLAGLSVAQYDQLKPTQWPQHSTNSRVFSDGVFSTHNQKAQFISVAPALPKQSVSDEYPFILNSGRLRDQWHTMTRTSKSDKLTQHTQLPFVYLNPADAVALAVKNNDLVKLNSAFGEVTVPVKIDKAMALAQCFLPIHWNKQFASDANIANLYSSNVDPISGQPESKHTTINLSKVDCPQYITIYQHNASSDQTLANIKSSKGYWFKVPGQNVSCLQLGLTEPLESFISWCQKISSVQGQWLSYQEAGVFRVACLCDDKLAFFATSSTQLLDNELDWFSTLMAKDSLAYSEIQLLLNGEKSEEFYLGKQVCSCFNIREKTITSAINSGCNSVSKLGQKLKCGTNCGSCKPELTKLLNDHSQSQATTTELATPAQEPLAV